MKITDKIRREVLAVLKRTELSKKEQKLIDIFGDPIAENISYDKDNNIFKKEGVPFELKHLKHLIHKGKLYFDFSKDAEEDKKFYEVHGDEWKEEYSYNKVGSIESDYASDFGKDESDSYFVMEDDEGLVDPCRFNIREIEYVDETHFDVIDRGWHDGDKRRFALR